MPFSRRVIQTIGILNILVTAAGVYVASTGAVPILARVHDSPATPYVRELCYVMSLVDFCCLVALTVGGIYLVRLKRSGLRICNLVFVIEIAWFLATAVTGFTSAMSSGRLALLGHSIAAASGIGSLGTAPQIITAYPVLALIFLNSARGAFPNHALQS